MSRRIDKSLVVHGSTLVTAAAWNAELDAKQDKLVEWMRGQNLAGVLLRHRGGFHKRIMVMATLCILPNAIVRLVLLSNINVLGSNLVILTMWALLVLCIVGVDAYRLGRLHPAFAWSGSLAIASLYLAWLASTTTAWNRYWIQVLG